MQDYYLAVNKWKPNFRPSQAKLLRMFVWVQFPEFPIEYYDMPILRRINSQIRVPIKIDMYTGALTRAKYAKVCVEVNIDQSLITQVHLEDFNQSIIYELITSFCLTCEKNWT